MGIFGNLKKNFNDGTLIANLQSAGAISGGDYGTAAQIQGLHLQRLRKLHDEAERRQQMQQTVAALTASRDPADEAAIVTQAGGSPTGRYRNAETLAWLRRRAEPER